MKITDLLFNPSKLLIAIDHYFPFLVRMGDKAYLRFLSRMVFGEPFNLDSPRTFNEKLNWLKINDHNPLYTTMADKYAVKSLIEGKHLDGLKTARCYGAWNHVEEIDFDQLPRQFVLKATHDSSGATICRDKSVFDIPKAKKWFNHLLSLNNYGGGREWVYKNIPPRVIAEEFLDDGTGKELTDYKFWCFNGEPKYMYITNKGTSIYENFYDMDFNVVPIDHGFPRRLPEYACPPEFQQMKEYATELSKGIPFVRVDFFVVNGNIYFGEFTFYDWGGLRPFHSDWDNRLGVLVNLPTKT